ncbi:uncharacterized protein LOC119740534 [Patiria miniata]|uniref:DUF7041 domain-containing protein n=1 Tax=Patiria miniata TaxID=46514 RepID=A0A914B7L8_PATMI|nr:uncharacterized protein LOC119740534 [Patiria miniata]
MPTTPATTSTGATAQPPVTATISLKLPPYWPSDPTIWFTQVEAQFTTRGITSEHTRYAYVVASLQPSIAQEVRDILITPPSEAPYTTLKKELIKRTSQSEQKRLHQLLTTEELGDRKPSQLLRKMQQLLGERTLEPSIMKQLFLQRLPTNARLILASTSEEVDIDQLAKLADKIMEVSPTQAPVSAHITTIESPPPTEIQQLRAEVANLASMISTLTSRPRERSRSRSQPRRQRTDDRRSAATATHDAECWYHQKFGAMAHKCTQPCSYKAGHQENDQAGK